LFVLDEHITDLFLSLPVIHFTENTNISLTKGKTCMLLNSILLSIKS